ncbi:unnamed protein product [Symbiodinium natans]|uniref:Uncharacterized protein n=1 Tax=Symbiodinium natans TaxID=878477 RepID=A0A812IGY4_9DINO|nr:unnamed protein product [Symbiodinium natans]
MMLAEQYRDFLEATTGAPLPPVSSNAPHRGELRRSTAATAAKVKEMPHPTPACAGDSGSERRSAMLQALAGLNEQPSQVPTAPIQPAMDSSAALQKCSAAALTSMIQSGDPRPSGRARRTSQLLQDALRMSSGSNFLLQRMHAASSVSNSEEAHSISFRSAVQAGRQYFDATLPPVPCDGPSCTENSCSLNHPHLVALQAGDGDGFMSRGKPISAVEFRRLMATESMMRRDNHSAQSPGMQAKKSSGAGIAFEEHTAFNFLKLHSLALASLVIAPICRPGTRKLDCRDGPHVYGLSEVSFRLLAM